jgi:ABC-type protease/lipase transport system fused ATPase/permease subunit
MLVVSHRPVALEAFDRILFLHDGRFVAVTAEQVRTLLAPGFAAPPARAAAAR